MKNKLRYIIDIILELIVNGYLESSNTYINYKHILRFYLSGDLLNCFVPINKNNKDYSVIIEDLSETKGLVSKLENKIKALLFVLNNFLFIIVVGISIATLYLNLQVISWDSLIKNSGLVNILSFNTEKIRITIGLLFSSIPGIALIIFRSSSLSYISRFVFSVTGLLLRTKTISRIHTS